MAIKQKAFDLECPGCIQRLKFTLTQSVRAVKAIGSWSQTEMVRCSHCQGTATLAVLATNAAPDDPQAAITAFDPLS